MSKLVKELVYWITVRDDMRDKKDRGGLYPWSNDPNMQEPRYCNVRREDDRVTRWVAKNWRDANVGDPNLTLAMVLARMVNWPDTLQEIGYPHVWNPERTKAVIRTRQRMGVKTWSSAYIISTCGRSMAKEDYVVDHVCDTAWGSQGDWEQSWSTLENAHRKLMTVDGLGSFLAAQVVADLKNTPGHPLQKAPDWHGWCAPGPGSQRGLSWYFHGHPDTTYHPRAFKTAIDECYADILPMLPSNLQDIHMQDFQNCLCEFSKYMRYSRGDRRVRNKYVPG